MIIAVHHSAAPKLGSPGPAAVDCSNASMPAAPAKVTSTVVPTT
jgi:hypothetical protein